MGKITPGVKAILVIITFLGFTNYILSETKLNFSEILKENIFPDKIDNKILSENSFSETVVVIPKTTVKSKTISEENTSKSSLAVPSITLGPNPEICKGTLSALLSYSAPSENPNHYSISFGNTAIAAGFANISNNSLPASPIQIAVPASVSPGTYNATLTVTNGTETSGNISFSVIIKPTPVAATKNIIVQLNASGNASIADNAVDNNSTGSCGGLTFSTDITAFTCVNVGPNTVTLTVTDTNGNSDSKTAIVTVVDNVAPVAIAQNVTVTLDASGNGATTAILVDNGSNDACGIASLVLSKTAFTCADIATNPNNVTLTVTDNNGKVSTATANVTVIDNLAPVAIAQNVTVTLDASGNGTTTATLIDNGSNDACGIASLALNKTAFTCADIASNPNNVILTVTDNNGKVSTATANVTVIDNLAPVAIAQNVTVTLDASGNGATTAVLVDNGSNDACGIASLVLDKTAFTCADIANNPINVTLTVTDNNGKVSTATANVTVIDNLAPVAIAQNVNVTLDASGNGATTAVLVDNGSNDACGIASLVLSKTTFTCSDIATNPNNVTLTVTDNNGKVSTATAKVTVVDNVAPVAIAQNVTVTLDASGNGTTSATLVNNGSNDACGIASLVLNKTAFTCADIATNPNNVTLTVTDNNGNTSTATANVTVVDNVAPVAIAQNVTVNLDASGNGATTAELVNNGSNDACGIATLVLNKTAFTCADIATNPNNVTLTVTDNNGKVSTATANVTVVDNIIPVISTNPNLTVNNDPGLCGAIVDITPPTVSNNCAVGTLVGTRNDGKALTAIFPVGSTTITWTVSDINGNTAVPVLQTVTVLDNESPVAPVLEDILWGCEYTLTPPVASDNCAGTITGTTASPLTYSTAGTYSITWKFTDDANNSSTSIQKLIIDQIKVDVDPTNILCNGFATGEAKAIVTGGVAPFTYDWGSLGNGPSKDGLSPGSYSVTVTDINGCTAAHDFQITQPDSFIEITGIDINKGCNGQNDATATIQVNGGTPGNQGYNISWSNGQTGPTASNLSPGKHTVTVSDENLCTIVKEIDIVEPEELIITNIVTTKTHTFGSATGSATVILKGGTPNYTFLWSDEQTGQIANNLAAGEYTVTVTDANGCETSEPVIIIDPLKAIILPTSRCLSDDGGLRTSGFEIEKVEGGIAPYTYHWNFGMETDNAQNTAEGEGIHIVDYISKGTYIVSLTVTDSVGNTFVETINHYVGECFESCGQTGNLDFVDSFFIGKEDGTQLLSSECESYQGKKYIYLKIDKNANAYNPSIEFIYTIYNPQTSELISEERITGCIPMEGNGKIPENLRIGEVNNWSCEYEIHLENFYLDWTNGSQKPCGDTRGNMCTSTNENGQIQFPLRATVSLTHNFCFGAEDGVINATAWGGVGTYSYELTNLQTGTKTTQFGNLFENLEAGNYDLVLKDDNDFYPIRNIIIKQPIARLELEKTSHVPLACNGGSNAAATVQASGGTAPYTIVWEHISQTATEDTGTATNLSAGTYLVSVVDSNGCEQTTEVTIIEPEKVIANAGADQNLKCGVNSVQLGAIFDPYSNPVTGEEEFGKWSLINGNPGSKFAQSSDPETLFSVVTAGTYTLRWAVPCGESDLVVITFTNCSTIDFDGVDDHIDFGDNYNLPSNFTLETWIKQDPSTSSGIKTILSKRDNTNPANGGFDLILENNTPKFRWNNSSISSNYSINTNRWFHIAVIKGGADEGLYVDGIKVNGETTSPGSPTDISAPFLIGAMYTSENPVIPQNFYHGWIEEVRIWETALTREQLRFMMNQRIKNNGDVRGEIVALDVPNNLSWDKLKGYYRLITSETTIGTTKNRIVNNIDGRLKNIQSTQQNTAPLPYISNSNGNWFTNTTWRQSNVWDPPSSPGINNDTIAWNIVELNNKTINNPGTTNNSNSIYLLALLNNGGTLNMMGQNNSSGNSLSISHYLDLNGVIDLDGESQLVQTEGSIAAGNGHIERDQQGTASSYNYNYWSSPVAPNSARKDYKVNEILFDGTTVGTNVFKIIDFQWPHTHADGAKASPIKISDYWINTFRKKTANQYSAWEQIGSYTPIKIGEGYTMKGTEDVDVIEGKLQNYTFKGFPNNGDIKLNSLMTNQNYLIGNPYPSALDANKFILDNLNAANVTGATNTKNVFNGALYFWDHFAGKTHYLAAYVGGYATRNLLDGVKAISTDERINADKSEGSKIPGRFIPVAQGFFINTVLDPALSSTITVDGGDIIFKNSQRAFVPETDPIDSQFLRPESPASKSKQQEKQQTDTRSKIRMDFRSPMGYNRQILVGADPNTTNGFDLGYDAPLNDNNPEDMFWLIDGNKFVIQGVPNLNPDQVLPLGIKISKEGDILIKINALENISDDVNIYLKNLQDSTYFDLRKADFKMSLEPGNYTELFEIVFQTQKTSTEDPDPDEEEETGQEPDEEDGNEDGEEDENENPGEVESLAGKIQVFYMGNLRELAVLNPDKLEIQQIIIYDMLGAKIQEFQNVSNDKDVRLPVREFAAAVYVVKLYSGNKEISKSIILIK